MSGQNLDAAFMALSTEWSTVIAAARHHDERSESRCGVHGTFDRVVKHYCGGPASRWAVRISMRRSWHFRQSGQPLLRRPGITMSGRNLDAAFMALSTEWSNVIAAARLHDERSESRCGVHGTFDRVVKHYCIGPASRWAVRISMRRSWHFRQSGQTLLNHHIALVLM